jgi:hypothetical protein
MKRSNWTGPLVAGLTLLAATPAWALPPSGVVHGGECESCATSCGPTKIQCPPWYKHIFEGPPKIHFKKGCPRPICDPCHLPHAGYFQTCWSPWPWPDDWGHCPTPTAAQMLPPPEKPLFAPKVPVKAVEPDKSPAGDRPKAVEPGPMPPPKSPPELPSPKPLDGDKVPSARLRPEEPVAPATYVPTQGTVRSAYDGEIPVIRLNTRK